MTPKHLAATAALSLLGLLSAPPDAPEIVLGVGDAYIARDGSGQSWTIGNDGIVFKVGLNEAGVLAPLGLRRSSGEVSWELEPTPGPGFQHGGRHLYPGQAGFPFRVARAEEYEGGVRLALVFDETASGLRLTRWYACYPGGAPAVETWSTFEAIGSATGVSISDIGIWQLTLPARQVHWVTGLGAGAGENARFTRQQQVLTRKEPFQIGSNNRSSEVAVPIFSFSGPAGRLFGGILWSGAWTLSVTGPAPSGMATVRVSAGSTASAVVQGEPFETPHGVFGVAAERDLDVTTALQQYVMGRLRRGRSFKPLVTYNTWFAHGTEIDDESMRAEMANMAGLGVELFVLDAGWSPGARSGSDYTSGLGSWTVDSRRFPAGLGPLGDYARSLGLKFGVWVEPERVDTAMLNRSGLREHFLATSGGRYNAGVKNEHADAAQICLADSEARQWVLAQLVRFIDTVRPDYLKWDNNYWINCDRSGHGHGTADGNLAHVKGLYALLAALRSRYPELVIENCSGGGNRLDLGMLQFTDVGWMDDVSGPSVHVRHNAESLGTLFPARYLLSFVMDDPAEPIHEADDMSLYFRSRMAGVLGLSLVAAEFASEDVGAMSREIALYKRLRDAAPEPVLALLTDQASEASTGSWDAVQLWSQATGGAFVLAFRGRDADRRSRVRPVNLSPGVAYEVSTPRGRPLGKIDGAALMENGVEVGAGPPTAGHVVVLTPIVK